MSSYTGDRCGTISLWCNTKKLSSCPISTVGNWTLWLYTLQMSHLLHLHLQRSVQGKVAFAHLHLEHRALQEHLTSSRHDLDTSGSVSQTGTQQPSSFFQPNLSGDGMFCWWSSLVAQIPAWYIDLFTCWRSASLKEEKTDNNEY